MKAPAFWSHRPPRLGARLLQPLGMLYGSITARRMVRPGLRLDVPVVCIGNFTAGGAGKTPTTIAIAKALRDRGENPFVVSRGYGGDARGPLRVDISRHSARDVGDEPLLLARHAPTIVCRDRLAGALAAAGAGASIILLDDGLQNPALEKTFALAVVDGGFGIGNGLCVPAGPLRAPLAAQRRFVNAALIIGTDATGMHQELAALGSGADLPVHFGALVPDADVARRLAGARVLAFAGIGRPEKFFATLRGIGCDVVETRAFADHHPFSTHDAQRILAAAETGRLQPATTEKDMARLRLDAKLQQLAERTLALPVSVALPPALVDHIVAAITAARARA